MEINFEQAFAVLRTSPLFAELSFEDFKTILPCVSEKKCSYDNGEIILLAGGDINSVGLLLSGRAQIIKEDYDGRSHLVAELAPPELFAEVFVCAGLSASPVTVIACDACTVLFLDYKKLAAAGPFHSRLIGNMLKIVARKNLVLTQKIELLSKKTIREKLLYFFDMTRNGEKSFCLNLDREELAKYINADRSAVSAELGKMRNEGLIKFKKNQFEILE